MEHKVLQTAGKIYFMAVAVLMYYFLTQTVNLGVFVTLRHVFALVLVGSTFLAFLIKPNVARGAVSMRLALIASLPFFVTIVVSLFIWFVEQVDAAVISRGLSGAFFYSNALSFSLAAGAFLYVFGEKGIWYNLLAILISNILSLLLIIAQNGIGVFVSEFIRLVITFAGDTGDVIVQAEIHELAFCLGAYLIYMLMKPRKNFTFLLLLGLSGFCFLAAFKRIGIIAIALALVLGWALLWVAKFRKSTAKNLAVIFSLAMMAVLVGYIGLIKMDVFSMLEEAGIETSGRVIVYKAVDKFYEFSPSFLGNGIGYLTYQLNTNMSVGVSAVHNDFLQYFVDLGFWGYLLWLASTTVIRVCCFGAKGRTENAILTFALCLYLVIASSTDNTVNYPLLTTTLAVIMMGHGFDEQVRQREQKLFGYISPANREQQGGALL